MSKHPEFSLKVMTFNMHKGFDAFGTNYVLDVLREALRSVSPDVVFLQEVMGHTEDRQHREKGFRTSQFEYLADSVWTHYAYGKNAVYSSGNHGNAILSKYPIRFFENINISTNIFERRGLLHGEIGIPERGLSLHLLCLHLNLLEGGRLRQIQRLVERVREKIPETSPLVLAGDFNDWRGKLTDRLLADLKLYEASQVLFGRHAKTFPAMLPLLPLDRIYFRGLKVTECKILSGTQWKALSDHKALLADFSFV